MKKNMGTTDQVIRLIIAVIISALYYLDIISGTVGNVMVVLAVVFFATSLVGFCPLYAIFGMNTCPVKKDKS